MQNSIKIQKNFIRIRSMGSAALNMAMVAMGAADANFEFGIHAWDIAAGILIVEEAGGIVLDPSGNYSHERIACNLKKSELIEQNEK